MKKNITITIAFCAAASVLFAQTERKIVLPTIAVVLPAKVEMDNFCTKMSAKTMSSIREHDTMQYDLDTILNRESFYFSEKVAKPIRSVVVKKDFPAVSIGGIAMEIQEQLWKMGQQRVILKDTILGADTNALYQFAKQQAVRYVLQPHFFTMQKGKDRALMTVEYSLYDTLVHQNIILNTKTEAADAHKMMILGADLYNRCESKYVKGFEDKSVCYMGRLARTVADSVLCRALNNDALIKQKIDLFYLKKAKMEALRQAKPDERVFPIVLPFLEEHYNSEIAFFKRVINHKPRMIPHYSAKDCHTAFFNADKTKFVALFATNIMIKQMDYTDNKEKMMRAVAVSLCAGIHQNGKWYIKQSGNNMTHLEADFNNMIKADFDNKTAGYLQDTSLAENPAFWQKGDFRDMKEAIAEIEVELKDELLRDKLYSKFEAIKNMKNDLKRYGNRLNSKESKAQIKQQIKFMTEEIADMQENPDSSRHDGHTDRLKTQRTFLQNEHPEGYELVTNLQLDSLQAEIRLLHSTLKDTAEVFTEKLSIKRPDLYQNTEEWEINGALFKTFIGNKKYYFITTSQNKSAKNAKYWQEIYEHHYLLFDIENKKWWEWTYPKNNRVAIPEREQWRSSAIFEQLAKWNGNYPMLNDPNFWANYVLKQENGSYLYLKPVF